jgi:uncharacterized protein (TIGR00299 family) protein
MTGGEIGVRVAHFDCFSGISGDMTLAALIDSGVDVEAIRRGLNSLNLPIQLNVATKRRSGIAGTHVTIEAGEQSDHRHLTEIEAIIGRSTLTDSQKNLALRIFRRLGEAEAKVHGIPLEKVHFHEVGALDSIADIVGSAIGLDLLRVDRFTSRPVPPGSGTVKCAHGLMPVPAPATALLLQGVPLASVPVSGEMTTPTGAAILTSVVTDWIDQPALTVERIGHGAGTKDFPDWPNVLRLLIGEESPAAEFANHAETDTVWVLETNLDDTSGELIGYCFDRLLAAGALDVYTTPIQMKKNRPGILVGVIATSERVRDIEQILFAETGTFGIRRTKATRSKLARDVCNVSTAWGLVRGKKGWREGVTVFSPEYEDCTRVAREQGLPLRVVYDEVREAFAREQRK